MTTGEITRCVLWARSWLLSRLLSGALHVALPHLVQLPEPQYSLTSRATWAVTPAAGLLSPGASSTARARRQRPPWHQPSTQMSSASRGPLSSPAHRCHCPQTPAPLLYSSKASSKALQVVTRCLCVPAGGPLWAAGVGCRGLCARQQPAGGCGGGARALPCQENQDGHPGECPCGGPITCAADGKHCQAQMWSLRVWAGC